jgi:hypothetical protein
LEQQLILFVKGENGKRTVQHSVALVTLTLHPAANLTIQLIHQDKLIVGVRNDLSTRH